MDKVTMLALDALEERILELQQDAQEKIESTIQGHFPRIHALEVGKKFALEDVLKLINELREGLQNSGK